jgi:hypothetical protein
MQPPEKKQADSNEQSWFAASMALSRQLMLKHYTPGDANFLTNFPDFSAKTVWISLRIFIRLS